MRRPVAAWCVLVLGALARQALAEGSIEGTYETLDPVEGTSFGGPEGRVHLRLEIAPGRRGSAVFTPEVGGAPVEKPVEWRFDKVKRRLAVKVAGKRVSGVVAEEGAAITYAGARWRRVGAGEPAPPAPVAAPEPSAAPAAPPAAVPKPAPVAAKPAPGDPLIGLWASPVSDGSILLLDLSADGRARLALLRGANVVALRAGSWARAAGALDVSLDGVVLRGPRLVDATGVEWLGVPWRKQ